MFNNTNKPKSTVLLILSFFILNSSFLIATVRYVSHSGTNTPPYTSWATAADSIMSAINISVFGDTIYVANGVYEEQVVMIPGLSLIGAGMDSCIIDTRNFASGDFNVVEVADSCLIKGFSVLASTSTDIGNGIVGIGQAGLITLNRVANANIGIFLDDSDIEVNNNICSNIRGGIRVENSSSLVKKNIVAIYESGIGIHMVAINLSYLPVIESNYIETVSNGIKISFGSKPTITNNTIILKGEWASAYTGSYSDTVKIFNNLIIAEIGIRAFRTANLPNLIINNYITGNFDDPFDEIYVIEGRENNVIENNVVTNAERGIKYYGYPNEIVKYNNSWNNDINYSGSALDTTNLSVDPMIVNDDTTQGELDFHLQKYSPLIDAGDPTILDKDSTRSDIGLYGGPFGERYAYLDLPPRPPVNLTAVVDSNTITLAWNKNTEADFNHYNLYRDTTANFIADSTTFVLSLTDTFYTHIIPESVEAFYYKLTATDNQGNVSKLSEELAVLITSVNEYPTIVNNYRLYQNYPNPFNPSTKIGYKLKERGYVKLYVYDVKGELVEVLVNQFQDAGFYEVEFHAGVGSGLRPVLASGIYIYQVHVISENNIPVFSDIKKMIYLK
jgi:hypothetical protein